VLKVASSRLLAQAEQFANELTRYLDICAPDCRIVRQARCNATCQTAGRLRLSMCRPPP
jgi:hypothetical protein